MISVILPTRGRPELFKRMCLSALDNAADPNDIEFVTYRDDDDFAVYEYFGKHQEMVGKRIVQSQMYNECYKIATGPIYMFAADDIVFYTKDWDKSVKKAFDQSADKIIFVYPNDKYARSSFGVVGFLHKNWIDTVGYFLPPYFAASYADHWINDIATKIDRRVFLRSAVIKEVGVKEDTIYIGMNEKTEQIHDKTHLEYAQKRQETNGRETYFSKEIERVRDAQLLQKFIKNFINNKMFTLPPTAFGTHLAALIKVINLSEGPILECGMGMFSTPFLHFACLEKKRKLVSYDNEQEYFEWYKTFENDYHRVSFVSDWDKIDVGEHWGVVLIDHEPKIRRKEEIKRLAHSADYIVVHDTQMRSNHRYRYNEIYPLFKYRKDFNFEKPFTAVLSNFKDLSNL